MKRFQIVLSLGILLSFASTAWPDVPKLIALEGVLTDSSGNSLGNDSLPVTLTLSSAGETALVVVPNRLGFAAMFGGSNPRPQNILLSAQGVADIPWNASRSQTWLEVEPSSGTATSIPQAVQASVDITGLNPGLYTDTIIFSSPTGGISDVPVSVFLQVFPPSELSDSVAIGDAAINLTSTGPNRFSVPIFASNAQAVQAIVLPLHIDNGQTIPDSVSFTGGRAEFADIKLFLRLDDPKEFLILIAFSLAPALPPGSGTICQLNFTANGIPPGKADTLVIDSTSVPNSVGDSLLPQILSVSYLVIVDDNSVILSPAFKGGTAILQAPCAGKGDMNADSTFTAPDVVLMLDCVFLGLGTCELCFVDVNCSRDLTPADVVLELNRVFLGSPFPC